MLKKVFTVLLLTCFVLKIFAQNNKESFYAFNKDWTPAKSIVEWSADAQVLTVVENSPAWQPAIQLGKPVYYRQREDITFQVTY